MVHDGKDVIDKEFKEWAADEYAKGSSMFTYMSDSPASISSCCRLQSKLTFSSTTGGIGVMAGSCNVITLNLNRIAQSWYNKNCWGADELGNFVYFPEIILNFEEKRESFVNYLKEILDRVYKYQIAYKTMLYDQEDKGMYSASNAGYIYLNKLYCTIGVLGYYEAAKFFKLDTDYNDKYIQFLQLIFSTIQQENESHSIRDKKRPFVFNTEAVPGEALGIKFYDWDKEDGFEVPEDQNLYNCYFYNPWDEVDVLTKLKLHGKQIATFLEGGQACHLNLYSHLSKEQYLKLFDAAIKFGTNYFTYNIPITECKECGHIVNSPVTECPKCKSDKLTYYTRIIGYLTCVDNWSLPRMKEFRKRLFGDKTINNVN